MAAAIDMAGVASSMTTISSRTGSLGLGIMTRLDQADTIQSHGHFRIGSSGTGSSRGDRRRETMFEHHPPHQPDDDQGLAGVEGGKDEGIQRQRVNKGGRQSGEGQG